MNRAILIDPTNKSVTEIEYDGDYRSISKLLGCELFTVALNIATLGEPDTLFVDDEGLLTYPNPHGYFRLPGLNYPGTLAGKGLLLGSDGMGGDAPALTRLEHITRAVEFIDTPAEDEVAPSITFAAW